MNRDLLRSLEEQGFTVEHGKRSGHLKVRKDGRMVAVLSKTASDFRASKNALAQLRRAGYRG